MENLIFDQRKRKAYLRSESHLDDLITVTKDRLTQLKRKGEK